jgi:hypothetical protein
VDAAAPPPHPLQVRSPGGGALVPPGTEPCLPGCQLGPVRVAVFTLLRSGSLARLD